MTARDRLVFSYAATSVIGRFVARLVANGQRAWAASLLRRALPRFTSTQRQERAPLRSFSYALMGASASHGLLLWFVPAYARPFYASWGSLVLFAIALAL